MLELPLDSTTLLWALDVRAGFVPSVLLSWFGSFSHSNSQISNHRKTLSCPSAHMGVLQQRFNWIGDGLLGKTVSFPVCNRAALQTLRFLSSSILFSPFQRVLWQRPSSPAGPQQVNHSLPAPQPGP